MTERYWPLALDTWDDSERNAMQRVIDSGKFTMGERVREFELEFARKFSFPYAVMVSSGSSANLIIVAAALEHGWLKRGDKVIVPAVGWSTSYFPFMQNGLELVFVDVAEGTWNIDPALVEAAITPEVKAVLGVNLLGNPCSFDELKRICSENELYLLEDNCESLGATYDSVYCGGIGEIGTFSTFFSHHLQTMEGGLVVCHDEDVYQSLISLRAHGWTRGTKYFTGDPFEFITMGYNVRPGELNGAIGIEQLKKWEDMARQRDRNANAFETHFGDKGFAQIQKIPPMGLSSWFGFGMIFETPEIREKARGILDANRIDHRPICAGNFIRQPVLRKHGGWSQGSALPVPWNPVTGSTASS